MNGICESETAPSGVSNFIAASPELIRGSLTRILVEQRESNGDVVGLCDQVPIMCGGNYYVAVSV